MADNTSPLQYMAIPSHPITCKKCDTMSLGYKIFSEGTDMTFFECPHCGIIVFRNEKRVPPNYVDKHKAMVAKLRQECRNAQ